MELPGVGIGEQVVDLLANPPAPDLTGHNNYQLCENAAELARLQRAVTVAQWRELDEMVAREGSRRAIDITADWLHAHSALLLHDARALVIMSVRMCANAPVLQAFAAGEIGEREAKYVVDFLAHPPKDMYVKPSPCPDEDSGAAAETAMSEEERETVRGEVRDFLLLAAGSRDIRVLRAEGERIRDVLSREVSPGDDIDRNNLDIAHYGKGRVYVRGDLDTETGENLLRALQPFMDRRPEFDGTEDKRGNSRRRADALSEWARRSQPVETAEADADGDGAADSADGSCADRAASAAANRGAVVRPRISIHIPIELLFGDIPTHAEACQMILDGRIEEVLERTGRGWVSRMDSVSLATAKRLACDCELTMIGADLNGAPLTVNTGQRLANKKLRIALEARDKGCSFPGCDRPVDWTQAHHMIRWELLHETQIDGLCLLCTAHHVAVHHQGWDVALGRNRFPVFRPPARIDPLRRWRGSDGNLTDDPPGADTPCKAA